MKEITLTLKVDDAQEGALTSELLALVTRLGAQWSIGSTPSPSPSTSMPKASEQDALVRAFIKTMADYLASVKSAEPLPLSNVDEIPEPPHVVSGQAYSRLLDELEVPAPERPHEADLQARQAHRKLFNSHAPAKK